MKLSIVILHYKGKDLLTTCLASVLSAVKKNSSKDLTLELVVVDNNSDTLSKKYLKKLEKEELGLFKVIYNPDNYGFAKGNNVGVKWAIDHSADYIMVLNNDVLIKDNFWQPLIDFIEKHPDVGLVSPKIYFAKGYEYHKDRYQKSDSGKVIWFAGGIIDWDNIYAYHDGVDQIDQGQFDLPKEIDFATGCCFMASAEMWQQVNFFDERYFLYLEDADFSVKVKQTGKKLFLVPESKIWHMNAGSSSCGGPLQDYFISRNRFLFGFKWASPRTKFALFRESLKILFLGRKWQRKAVIDFYLSRFAKGSWK